jgi:hypothetical protein
MRIDLQIRQLAITRKSCHILTYLMAVITGSLLMQLESSLICLIAATVNCMCGPWTEGRGDIFKGWMGNLIALPHYKNSTFFDTSEWLSVCVFVVFPAVSFLPCLNTPRHDLVLWHKMLLSVYDMCICDISR